MIIFFYFNFFFLFISLLLMLFFRDYHFEDASVQFSDWGFPIGSIKEKIT